MGQGANVFTFIMEYENYSFVEALKMLAERAGVELPEMEYSKEAKEKANLKNTLLEMNKLAGTVIFNSQLKEKRRTCYRYLTDRGYDTTITQFGLGYSNKYSDDL